MDTVIYNRSLIGGDGGATFFIRFEIFVIVISFIIGLIKY